jgi:hypothetical protein
MAGSRRPAGSNNWQPFVDLAGDHGTFVTAALAVAPSGDVHLVAVGANGSAWYAPRQAASTTWSAFVDLRAQAGVQGLVVGATCATAATGDLSVLLPTSDGALWQALRQAGGTWTNAPGGQVTSAPPRVVAVACSTVPAGGLLDAAIAARGARVSAEQSRRDPVVADTTLPARPKDTILNAIASTAGCPRVGRRFERHDRRTGGAVHYTPAGHGSWRTAGEVSRGRSQEWG